MAQYLIDRDLPGLEVDFDSESGTFGAYGEQPELEQLLAVLRPYTEHPDQITALIREAVAAGFEFDD